jgi:hypothetical protein
MVPSLIHNFPGKIFRASITYTRKLRKEGGLATDRKDFGARLPGWKGKFLPTSNRETPVQK